MSKLVLFIVNISHIEKDEILYKHLLKRHLFPIGNDKAFFTEDTTLSLKLEIQNTESPRLYRRDFYLSQPIPELTFRSL